MFTDKKHVSRRRFLAQSGLGLFAFAAWPQFLQAMDHGSAMSARLANPNFKADVDIELSCKPASVAILLGSKTQVLQYTARLLQGPQDTLTEIPGSYLGPVMRFKKGQKVRIQLVNGLNETTVAHWHGLHVPADQDGHPLYAIGPGEKLVYEFEVLNRAGMNIYHPHPHEATARQVYHGLAGAIIVNDDEESALGLPSGAYEIPLVIQDRLFDADNQLVYARNMHDRMMGFYGDRMLVNGRADFQLDVDSRAYRLRFLNGSNARIYKLAWDDGTPMTVIGVDGGLLEKPETKPYVMLAPGERLDVWMDFSGRAEGSQMQLRSLPFSGALPHMGMMMQRGGLPMGGDYPIFSVKVTRKVSDSPKLPSTLSQFKRYALTEAANLNKPVPIAISEKHMAMLLNGRPHAYNDVQDFERIPVNTIQVLDIFHAHGGGHQQPTDTTGQGTEPSGGMGMRHGGMGMGGMRHGGMGGMGMMAMAHPIHLHGQQFQILSRSVPNGGQGDYATVRDGFIDSGLKDTVLVMPGESIRIIKPFQDFTGLFMYHCHNLEHEDMGMMRDFLVV